MPNRRAGWGGAVRRGWPYAVLAVLAAGLAVQLVRLLWAVLVPISPLGDWQPQRAQVMEFAQRIAVLASVDPFFRGPSSGSDTVQVTAINMTLHGVTMNEATGGGSAIVAGADGVQNSYAVGDEVMAGVTLAAVAFDHVILDRGGARETLFMAQGDSAVGGTAAMAGSGTAAITSGGAAAAGKLASGEWPAQAILQGVAFSPRQSGGKISGVQVAAKGDGAVFRAMGLQAGDVVRAVNGRAIAGADDVAALNAMMKPGARVSLEVERGAGVVPVALFIAK